MNQILVILVSYLIGSIPFSYISSKAKGKDPRKTGTGNVGASNVVAVAGKRAGVIALTGDILKGIAAIAIARYYSLPDWGIALAGLAAVIGHDFSIFLGFKGGKGIATTGGVLIGLQPIFAFLVLLLWFLIMLVLRYFIPSTILVLCLVPFMMWMGSFRLEYIGFAVGALFLALYAHRNDIKRFLAGEELSISDSLAKYLKKK
jgi:glycerol-3-phosphate acyltransferase PlsY